MKRLSVLLALALPSALMAWPAAAAPNDAQRYAACLANLHEAQARELLQASTLDAAGRPYRALVDDNRCVARIFGDRPFSPADDAFSTATLRGNLAEQLLLKRSAQLSGLEPLSLQQKRYVRPWFAATGRHSAVDEMATCMADTDPADITALIRTESGSGEEWAAFDAMSAALTKCLSAGTRISVDKHAIRAALAEALYQRLSNPQLSMAK
jgi:hypothetical protein